MPLLDIAISQPCSCFRNNILAFRSEAHFHNKLVVGNDTGLGFPSAFSWKTLCITEKMGKKFNSGRVKIWRGGLTIRAIATLEIASVKQENEGVEGYKNMLRVDIDSVRSNSTAFEPGSSSEDSREVNEREKLRRMRISKANKGNTPWNKGKKHSPETIQRIKERTRLAMQDPKVKMKLINFRHVQSEETRMKIGIGVRLGWERRREKLMLQETCHYEWQNLIAEAARKGIFGQEELQWDSYKTLKRQLEQEWSQSVEERKNMPRPKGSKRAPKSAEQKRKISEAISAKWADPVYRNRVWSGLAKFHGISERVDRKPRRKPSGDGQIQKRSPTKKDEIENLVKCETKSQVQRVRLNKSKAPSYNDPFASSKLEMLKNIRAQRAAVMNKKSEAISRAKLLIAEAEKAAEALELAAKTNPHVQTSLIESRMLIAEAIQFIQSIDDNLSEDSTEPETRNEEEIDPNTQTPDIFNHREVNGVHSLSSSDIKAKNLSLDKIVLPDLVNGNVLDSCHNDLHKTNEESHWTSCDSFLVDLKPNLNGIVEQTENRERLKKQLKRMKKWVRGRLVEVVEET